MRKLFFFALISVGYTQSMAQSNYDRQAQNREYQRISQATQRAYSVPSSTPTTSTYRPPTSTTSNSSSSSSNSSSGNTSSGVSITPATSSSWGDGGKFQRQQNAIYAKDQADLIVYQKRVKEFERLTVNIPKNEENYQKLVNIALSVGLSGGLAYSLNAAYEPRKNSAYYVDPLKYYVPPPTVIELPRLAKNDQTLYDKYTIKAEELRKKKDYKNLIEMYKNAYAISPDPSLMYKIGMAYFYNFGNFNQALTAFLTAEKSPILKNESSNSLANDIQRRIGSCNLFLNNLSESRNVLLKEYNKEKYKWSAIELSYAYY